MVLWVLLSAMRLRIARHGLGESQRNVAPIPLLWVVPLALYLLTLHPGVRQSPVLSPDLVLSAGGAVARRGLAYLYISRLENWPIQYVVPAYLPSLFVHLHGLSWRAGDASADGARISRVSIC